MFACYLLQSEASKHRSYVGFTVNPRRRIRQHNGFLQGGARKTKTGRPWRMLLVCAGFTHKVQALQFEWTWQHPSLGRVSKDAAEELPQCKLTQRRKQKAMTALQNLEVLAA